MPPFADRRNGEPFLPPRKIGYTRVPSTIGSAEDHRHHESRV